ncbi:hypothetical protein D8B46_01860 [Candidatus Gracilibacteria bacterium]|nr:MAG: hypothetical protein D8B46_01860 [Candidatus Gracilibacteria bacterium]
MNKSILASLDGGFIALGLYCLGFKLLDKYQEGEGVRTKCLSVYHNYIPSHELAVVILTVFIVALYSLFRGNCIFSGRIIFFLVTVILFLLLTDPISKVAVMSLGIVSLIKGLRSLISGLPAHSLRFIWDFFFF